jgi:Rieske Fe-S protein
VEPEQGGRPHLPAPTLYPVGFAAGIACLLVGLIVSPKLIAPIGGAIAIVFAFLWIRDATSEYRGVPEPVEPERREAPAVETAPARPAQEGEAAMPLPSPGERFPRSKFLEASTLGLGAVIGGIVTLPAVGFAVAPAFVGQRDRNVDLGPLDDFPEGQWLVTTFTSREDEGNVSRRTAFVRNNGIVDEVPSFTIISNRCVHLGCPVQPQGPIDQSKKKEIGNGVTTIPTQPSGFGCPCHGGAYDSEGNRIQGPPVRALDRYEYLIRNNRLWLGKRYSVASVSGTGATAKIEAYKRADPSVHVDGPEQYLYPYTPGG